MDVTLKKPEIEQYIDKQVKAGNFPSAEAVVENALLLAMQQEEIVLTDEDIAAINLSDEQIDRGEGIRSEEAVARMRKEFGIL